MEQCDSDLSASSSSDPSVSKEVKGRIVKSEDVRSFSLGSVGAVSRSLPRTDRSVDRVLGCDTDKMPPASQTRNRTNQGIKGVPHSVSGKYHQPDRGRASQRTGYLHFQPARRTSTFTSHPPLRPTALHAGHTPSQRKVRNSTSTMDYMPSPESFCTPDFFKSSLNPSPSSLYTYDQDHQDMNATFHDTPRTLLGQMCTSQDAFSLPPAEPEFDLHPQFENSNSLDRFFSGAGMTQVTHTESSADFQGDRLKREIMTILQPDFSKIKPGPTLTEVNVDPYLFDDSGAGSMTVCEGGKLSQKRIGDVKKETSTQIHPDLGPKTFTPLTTVKTTNQNPAAIIRMLQQSQSSPSHTSATSLSELLVKNRTRKVAAVSPILTPTTTTASTTTIIKTEPVDTESTPTDSNPCLHKILTSPSLQPTPHARAASSQASSMPSRGQVGGQGRPPPLGQQGKSGSVEEKWREIEKFIHDPNSDQSHPSTSTGSSAMDRKRKRHGSGGSGGMSDEESVKSQRIESITDDDSDSDDDSDVSDTPFEESLTELAKNSKQYFWQYNIQAKGPKGTRLQLNISDNDPHRPVTFEDPVFDPTNTSLVGIRHAGKARRGDGNEITPNPRKLYMIGQKLCKLNRDINSVQMASNLPASVRSKSRKEKNKLSSRACRLKKKAQHEANKIKLFGLNCEQGELLDVVRLIWPNLRERAKQQMKENIPLLSNPMAAQINSIIKTHNKTRVAGNTADYVNQVIARVEDGDLKGGLDIKLKVKS